MLPRTLFLSRLIGLYCILVALSMITRRQATLESVTAVLGDGSRAQYLVGRCADDDRHPRRLDDADQEPVLFVPVAGGGSGVFPSAASVPRTFLRVRSYFTRSRHLPDLWWIQVNITLASFSARLGSGAVSPVRASIVPIHCAYQSACGDQRAHERHPNDSLSASVG
jgi:hypothetical protein